MITHVHNPFTRSPRLRVSMTVEEVHQLRAALNKLLAAAPESGLTDNQKDALLQLERNLDWAMTMGPPHGIKGATP